MASVANIAIGIPSTDQWHARFGTCLAALCAYFGMHRLPGVTEQRLHIMNHRGSMLAQQRDNIVIAARQQKCSHILFLDSDMLFPRNALHRLYSHQRDVVSTNCVIKKLPASPTASLLDGSKLYTDADSEGLVEVGRVGFAVALIKLDIFDKITRPYHHNEWIPEVQHQCGEDVYLCEKLKKAGFKIYIDQELSHEVGHIGTFIFTHDFVGSKIAYEDTNEVDSGKAAGVLNAKGV
jgi:hypothetical protein